MRHGTLIAAAVFYTLGVVLSSIWSYHSASRMAMKAIDQRLLAGTAGLAYVLADDFHDRAVGPGILSDEEDVQNIHHLSDLAEQGGYAFLFTVVQQTGGVFITSSSATPEEWAEGREVRYFEAYEEAAPHVSQALMATQAVIVSYTDRWGEFRGAYAPKTSPSGNRYLACAEIEISIVQAQLRSKLLESAAVALFLLLASLPLFGLVIRKERLHAQALAAAHQRLNQETKERKVVERQLVQAQKMEALGTLAGGVAHDFNNILAAIYGFTELALDSVAETSATAGDLKEIQRAIQRAKELIQQIQTFARRSGGTTRPVRVKLLAREVLTLVQSSLSPRIRLESVLDSEACVRVDPISLHQVMMNLCTNAVQAMEAQGGRLTLTLKDVRKKAPRSEEFDALPDGDYVQITVADTGSGIAPELLGSIFEPYFTTKLAGRGSGLGLAVVDGIVKSLGGEIHVQSTLGQGSTFTVWLPITHEAEIAEPVSLVTAAGPRSGAHILVVDDEAMVGQTTGRLLESMGYRVVICQSGAEALGLISDSPEPFDLVLTDLIMPGLSGDKLMETLAASHPDLPVILCTGFVERLDVTTQNRLSNAHRLLRKPFTKDELADVVRAVLLEG